MSNPVFQCIAPGCTRRKSARGLCASCYQGWKKIVDAGETTWEQLAAEGKCTNVTREQKMARHSLFISGEVKRDELNRRFQRQNDVIPPDPSSDEKSSD